MDKDIRAAYRGGFCYANPRFTEKDLGSGIVLDVNSLYPSQMYYRMLPYGEPVPFLGEYQKDEFYPLYVQLIVIEFHLKQGHIPTIQIKKNPRFVENEYLTDNGFEPVAMWVTNIDLELIKEHYEIDSIEYIRGYKFKACNTFFREYIDKWMKVKMQATIDGNGGLRTLAKLMLNALYGKFGLNPSVRSHIPYYDSEKNKVCYRYGEEETRDPIYIPMAVFITSWARYTTITAAQSCYDRFCYADTDSLHLIGLDEPAGIEVDPVKLGAWKHESTFTRARYVRQKCYAEEIDGDMKITCAGMPERSYKGVKIKKEGEHFEIKGNVYFLKPDTKLPDGVYNGVTWDNFHKGNTFLGRLRPIHTAGGIVLINSAFTIKA